MITGETLYLGGPWFYVVTVVLILMICMIGYFIFKIFRHFK